MRKFEGKSYILIFRPKFSRVVPLFRSKFALGEEAGNLIPNYVFNSALVLLK